MKTETIWLLLGLCGQGIFSARFIVQWLISEKQKKSIIPPVFWYLSLAGSLVLLLYAVYKRDPVFIMGQAMGIIIYVRNIMLIQRVAISGNSGVATIK